MNTKAVLIFLFACLCVHVRAQMGLQNKMAATRAAGVSPDTVLQSADPVFSAISPSSPQKNLLPVLFATNEDCVLFINDEEREVVSKTAFATLKLAPGTYRYAAKCLATGDVYRDTFSIKANGLNEIFIDMLYAVDAEKERKAALGNKTTPAATATPQRAQNPQTAGKSEPAKLSKEKELAAINSVVAGMVPVKGGSFVMGNNRSPSADETEHSVFLNGFRFGRYEVTQEQWESIMGDNPSLNRGCSSCPVENVSWEEAMRFIRKLNSITGKRFRLPTEAEWEYVAKWGGKAEIDKAGGVEEYIRKTAWGFINSESKTHPVGQKQANALGIYDLFGNVSEWCMDWYGAFFYKEDYTDKNPEGPPLGKDKIIRGGNYKDYVGDRFRPSFRNKMNPKAKSSEVGLRLVMEAQE